MGFFILLSVSLLLTIPLRRKSQVLAADLCGWEAGRSIIVNESLYFMGGNFVFRGDTTAVNEQQLYSINISSSFPVDGIIDDYFLHSVKGPQTAWMNAGAFFTDADSSTLYAMAGFTDNVTDGIDTVNAYNPQLDTWSEASVSGGAFNKLDRGQSMFATTQSSGLGLSFMAGGIDWIPGLLTFDASDPHNLSWTNSTDQVPFFWGAATEYVRFGNKGILVSVGGYTDQNKNGRDMSAVQVYDVDSQRWFEVTADGDIPLPRSSFCSGLSSAADDSSFQMVIYGGYNGRFGGGSPSQAVLGDVYVLTLPSFRWIKVVNNGYPEANTQSGMPRRRHLCNVYQDRQMLVLGGTTVNNTVSGYGLTCNSSLSTIKMFDTTTLTFQSKFPLPNATYEVPPLVFNIIGGGPDGGATAQKPTGGFNITNNGISASDIFSKRVPRYSPATASHNTTVAANPPPSTSHTAAIVGGVVGGAAGLAIGLAALFLLPSWLRRRKQSRSHRHEWPKQELSAASTPSAWGTTKPGPIELHAAPGGEVNKPSIPHEIHGTTMRSEMDGSVMASVSELDGAVRSR